MVRRICLSYIYDAGDRLVQAVDSVTGTITRSYDGLDRLTAEVSPSGSVSYFYDAAGRRTGMNVSGHAAVTYQYDNANRLTQITQGTSTVAIQPDSDGRRQSVTLPNGVTMTYGYDAASQLTGINYTLGGNTLGNLTYAHDLAGRRIRVSGFVLANPDRTDVGGTFARTGMPNALTSASYNANNQLTQFGGASLTYDANGNLTSDGSFILWVILLEGTYTWNARNQLVSILPRQAGSGGVAASFQYAARVSGFVLANPEVINGRRVSKTIGGTTQYVYDGANPVQEISGTTTSANLLAGGVDEYFQRTDSAGARNYLTDALGSTLALADSAGTIQTSYTFEPFGNTTVSGASTTNSFTFTGRELDTPNLYFYRARYYNPQLQRFIGEDHLAQEAGVNVYAYAFNTPVDFIDPFGLCATRWDRFKLGLKGASQLLIAGGKIVEGVGGIVAAPESGGLSLALSVYALYSLPQNLVSAAGDIGGAITGDVELTEKFDQSSAAFGTVSGLVTYASTRNLQDAAFAGNVENLAGTALGAGIGRPFSAPDLLRASGPELPEVPNAIKAYDAAVATQAVLGNSLGHRKDQRAGCTAQ